MKFFFPSNGIYIIYLFLKKHKFPIHVSDRLAPPIREQYFKANYFSSFFCVFLLFVIDNLQI